MSELLRRRRHRLSTSIIHETIISSTLSYFAPDTLHLKACFFLNLGGMGEFQGLGIGLRFHFTIFIHRLSCRTQQILVDSSSFARLTFYMNRWADVASSALVSELRMTKILQTKQKNTRIFSERTRTTIKI